MFHFTDDLKRNQFFWFEKHLFSNMNWAKIPKASKAIYPVIRSYCNRNGESFPGEETTSALCGRIEKIVRSGVKGLEGFPGIRLETYTSKRGRSTKKFTCKIPRYEKGKVFPFHRDILLGGNWAQLKPTAQALYPVMRFFGYNDYYEYWGALEEEKGEEVDLELHWEDYKFREFDFCEAEQGKLCEYAGIAPRSYWQAINNLIEHCLIQRIEEEEGKYKVYLHPPRIYKRAYMNKQIMERVKEENTEQKPGKASARPMAPKQQEETFNDFWDLYPNKVGREDAIKLWNKLVLSWDIFGVLIDALVKQTVAWKKEGEESIPSPATWLNEKSWKKRK